MKEFIKNNKIKLVIIICVICAGLTTVSAAVILFSSSEVSYDNTASGMSSDNVQDAIDELYGVARLSDRIDELEEELHDYWKTVYPVGSIYISTDSSNPSTKFGGTWAAYGSGKTLVGVDTSDTSFNTVEKTGGEKTHVLTPAETALKEHTHTVTIGSHTHGMQNHTHNIGHTHTYGISIYDYYAASTFRGVLQNGNGTLVAPSKSSNVTGTINGGQTTSSKSVKVDIKNATTNTSNASRTGTVNSDGPSNNTTTSTDLGTKTTSNVTTANGSAHNNLQPYITVYMWKRTA